MQKAVGRGKQTAHRYHIIVFKTLGSSVSAFSFLRAAYCLLFLCASVTVANSYGHHPKLERNHEVEKP